MNSFSEITKRITSLFRYGTRLRPMRDWLIVIIVSVVLVAVSIVWNTFTFLRLTRGESLNAPVIPTSAISQDSIGAITTIFKKRATEAERYKSEYHFVDPSH